MNKQIFSRLLVILMLGNMWLGLVDLTSSVAIAAAAQVNHTYYVDSTGGNDANNGLTESQAWKTLDRVNAMLYEPGDSIQFKTGGIWTGQLWPKGSGAPGAPIKIGKYGTGTSKPVIDGGGTVESAVYLSNQQYWEISELEITNNAAEEGVRRGVYVFADNAGILSHIYLTNLYIHDVRGDNSFTGTGKGTGGIYFYVNRDKSKALSELIQTRFNDILVENNSIERVGRSGISMLTEWQKDNFKYWNTGVMLRNNRLSYIDGDGIILIGMEQPVMEYNVISNANYVCGPNQSRPGYNGGWAVGMFPFFSEGTKMQYNEVYGTRSTQDGQAFDIDGNNNNALLQYNYSHDNEGGFALVMVDNYAKGSRTTNSTIRYNISQNDKNRVFTISNVSNVKVYNNTVYIGSDLDTTVMWHKPAGTGSDPNGQSIVVPAVDNISYNNNLIYNLGSGGYTINNGTNMNFSNNWYYGNHPQTEPAESGKAFRQTDPKLVNPGSGGTVTDLVYRSDILPGYKLQNTSPLIDAGIQISGLDYTGLKDFWGGNALAGSRPDIGAHEFQGTRSFEPQFGALFSYGAEEGVSDDTALKNTLDDGVPSAIAVEVSDYHLDISSEASKYGSNSLKYSGTLSVASDVNKKVAFKTFENLNIPITAATNFSYWINPSDSNGKYASVDFTYRRSDGTTGTFINTGIKDMNGASTHPNTGHIKTSDPNYSLPLNQWTQVAMNIGGNASLVGRTIIKLTIKFDTTASYNAQGSFSGYIDDIRITNQAVAAAAPTASNINLIGSNNGAAFAGSQLTGSYTYEDANGEPEFGSVFEWLSAPTAGGTFATINGATYSSFTPTASLIGKYIKFKVTPKNVYDLGTGTPVESAPIQIKGFDGTTGFEAGDFPAIVNTVDGNGGRKMSITNENAEISSTVANSGSQSFAVSGTANTRLLPTDGTYVDFITFNASIPITADTKLSYWIYPTNEISRNIGIDFSASGSSLRDSGAVDKTGAGMHPNKAHKPTGGNDIPLNEWTQIVSDIGSYPNLRGKTIETIKIKFDNPGAVGNFLAYFDDIEITDVALQDQVPTAHTVALTGDASVGAILNGSYVYRDAFGKPETGSTYKWLRGNTANGTFTEIPGATAKSYTLTAAEVGKYVKFEVTPKNNSATSSIGLPKQSGAAIGPVVGSNLQPKAPIASEVAISGSKLLGSLVTGSYTYLDPNGDLESGSRYRWLRSDSENGVYTVIANATETTYLLTREDTDKYLKFEVTPETNVAPETGVSELSSAFGPVTQPIKVAASFVTGNGAVATQLTPNQLLTGNAVIVNQNTVAANVLIILALYDSSGSMVNVSFSQKNIAAGASDSLSAGFKLPGSTVGYSVKMFAAGGTSIYSALIPLSNVFEIQ